MTQGRHLRVTLNISLSTTFNWSPCFIDTSIFSLPFVLVTAFVQAITICRWDCCNNLLVSFSILVCSLFKSISPGTTKKIFRKCRCYVVTLLSPQIRIDYRIFIRISLLPAHLQTPIYMYPMSLHFLFFCYLFNSLP